MKFLVLIAALLLPALALADVLEDEPDQVETLPSEFPKSWVYVRDFNIGTPLLGRIQIVDVAAPVRNYKGALSVGYLAGLALNNSRGEAYVSETYYSRGTRGTRVDLITVYDQATLTPKAEIMLEPGNRLLSVPMESAFRLGNGGDWAFVYNYTPAASVSVVDLAAGEILSEIPIPGCSMVYPLAGRGFMTLCGYGEALTIALDENGGLAGELRSDPFNDIDDDPHFMKVTRVGDTIYLATFKGKLTAIDLSGDQVVIGDTWSLVTRDEEAAGWRPGGWQVITSDARGRLYVLMHEGGENGSHKSGGSEVWVFDPATRERLARYVLDTWGVTIEATQEDKPHLVVANANMMLDVYDAATGGHIRTIAVADTAFLTHIEAVR